MEQISRRVVLVGVVGVGLAACSKPAARSPTPPPTPSLDPERDPRSTRGPAGRSPASC